MKKKILNNTAWTYIFPSLTNCSWRR